MGPEVVVIVLLGLLILGTAAKGAQALVAIAASRSKQ